MSLLITNKTNNALSSSAHSDPLKSVTPASVLEELRELLEEYAPTWYTESQHSRVLTALRMGKP